MSLTRNKLVHIAAVIIFINKTIIIMYRKCHKCALNFLTGESARQIEFSGLYKEKYYTLFQYFLMDVNCLIILFSTEICSMKIALRYWLPCDIYVFVVFFLCAAMKNILFLLCGFYDFSICWQKNSVALKLFIIKTFKCILEIICLWFKLFLFKHYFLYSCF